MTDGMPSRFGEDKHSVAEKVELQKAHMIIQDILIFPWCFGVFANQCNARRYKAS